MKLNVSNHHGSLLADHFLDPQYIQRVFVKNKQVSCRNLTFIDHISKFYYWGGGGGGGRMIKHITVGKHNRRFGLICCKLTDTYCFLEIA